MMSSTQGTGILLIDVREATIDENSSQCTKYNLESVNKYDYTKKL